MSAALWIWAVTLAVVSVAVVPLALYLLHRTLRAAMSIERYTREALQAGVGIARNTADVAALDETIDAAASLLETARRLNRRSATIATTVASRGEGRPN